MQMQKFQFNESDASKSSFKSPASGNCLMHSCFSGQGEKEV